MWRTREGVKKIRLIQYITDFVKITHYHWFTFVFQDSIYTNDCNTVLQNVHETESFTVELRPKTIKLIHSFMSNDSLKLKNIIELFMAIVISNLC